MFLVKVFVFYLKKSELYFIKSTCPILQVTEKILIYENMSLFSTNNKYSGEDS